MSEQPLATDAQREKGAAATVCAGAVLATLGTFTTWIVIDQPGTGLSLSRSGLDWSGDAKWLIALAVLAALGAVAKVTGWKLPPIIGGGVVIDGAIMLAIGIYDAVQVIHRETAARGAGLAVHMGAGLWLSIGGAAAVTVGGFVLMGGWPRVVHEARTFLQPRHPAQPPST